MADDLNHGPSQVSGIPWYCYVIAIASTCIAVGLQWDISWHMTIGRDTFWTPAHMVIYIGGILGGVTSAVLVFKMTFFDKNEGINSGVRFWGFTGPMGAWVCIWGAVAMLTSAPFDDWWHNAYGLDVEIISPPHMVLAAGFIALVFGAMLLTLVQQNRSNVSSIKPFSWFYTYTSAILILLMVILTTEYSFTNKHHSLEFYRISALAYPVVLVAIGRSSKLKWPATTAALIYMLHRCIMVWVLPLFEGQPLLAPIYREVTHFIPPPFPVLLFIPAVAIDLIILRTDRMNDWIRSLAIGLTFVLLFFIVHWYFSEFLLSESARNWFFSGHLNKPYWARVGPYEYKFWEYDYKVFGHPIPLTPVSLTGLFSVSIIAAISARVGLWWGQWMRQAKR